MPKLGCEGTTAFSPDALFTAWARGDLSAPTNNSNDLAGAISRAFGLKQADAYVYHATASVTLAQVQRIVEHGGQNNLHAWYKDGEGKVLPSPPQADITAYTTLFQPSTSTPKSLVSLTSNAKKASLRASIASHLTSTRLLPSTLTIPRQKTHTNPYLDFWIWSCHNLEYAGPDPSTVNIKQSHAVLPIFYHHFGCVVPTFEACHIIKQLGAGRTILDIGSGNGYWSYMLRRFGLDVHAVDNGDSLWRTYWIPDTIVADGAKYLINSNTYASVGGGGGGRDKVLLLVYPQATTEFTHKVLKAYSGSMIVVAGTQNRNGFTGFREKTMEEYVVNEMPGAWRKVVQTALPSFAGKDEALFVFEKGEVS